MKGPRPKTSTLVAGVLLKVRPTIAVSLLKKVCGIRRRAVLTEAGRFWVDPVSGFGHALEARGEYEPATADAVRRCLADGATFVDVGANEGYFTVIGALAAGPRGMVAAVEPQRRLQEVIARNICLNGLANVKVFGCALSDGTERESEIWLSPSTDTGSSSMVSKYPVAGRQPVRCRSLDEIAAEAGMIGIDLVKVDVEGYEPEVLRGCEGLFARRAVRNLLIDYHLRQLGERGLDPEELHRFVCGNGFIPLGPLRRAGYNLYRCAG